jgi:hypothetical protein
VDDGARSLDGLTDRGIQSHSVTRASHLRPGQQLQLAPTGIWHTIQTVEIVNGEVIATTALVTFIKPEADLVKVRDILHTYTESDTP